jgi:uncharacterized membrane protein
LDAQKKEVSLLGAFRVSLQELQLLYAFYIIHGYYHKNWDNIKLGLLKEKPDISVRFVEKDIEDVTKFLDTLDKILINLKDPIELKVIDESKKIQRESTNPNSNSATTPRKASISYLKKSK